MFNLLNEGFLRKYLKEDVYKALEKEIRRELKRKGYNVDVDGADNYISAAAEYIQMSREYGEDLTADEWLSETEINYPEDLAFMKGLKEQLPEGVATLKDIRNKQESLNEDKKALRIPRPYNKYFEFDTYDTDESDFKYGDEIYGYDCRFLAWLQPKERYVDFIDSYPMLTDDPKYPVVDLVGGRLYPVDIPIKNESLSAEKANKLYEAKWRHQLKSGIALRKAINSEEYEAVKNALIACYKELHDLIPEDFDEDDLNDKLDDLEFLDTAPDEEINLDEQDVEDNWNYELNDFYDYCDAYNIWVSLSESLKENDYFDFNSDIYNALAEVMFKYRNKEVDEVDLDKALTWFADRFFEYDFEECLNECIKKLNEAEMSPEDKADSDMLRKIYKKINGSKVSKNTLTPEEQEILKKYNLDAWGFRGDTKMVTDNGRKDVIKHDEIKRGYFSNRNNKFDKINYADRARKIDSRDYAQEIRRRGWGQSFDDAEKEYQQKQLSQNVDKMKSALRSRNYYRDEIDNSETNLNKRLDQIDKHYIKTVDNIEKETDSSRRWNKDWVDRSQQAIDQILDKHRVKECLNRLNEAEMSPEDKADSEILKQIYRKILNRSNAKLTPEEENIIKKYDLVRTDRNLTDKNYNPLFTRNHMWYSNDEINFADKARKLSQRDYAKEINNMNPYDHGNKFQDRERSKINIDMSKDVNDMKRALGYRAYHKQNLDNLDKSYQDKIMKATKDRSDAKEKARKNSEDNLRRNKDYLDKYNSDINKLLKKESLNEDVDQRVIKTGLLGKKNNDILKSIIGQLSDGYWENSPGMNGYWMFANISDTNDILIDNRMYNKDGTKNKFYNMSDNEILKFFSNKIKFIAQVYLNDNNLNPYKNWNADNEEECSYLDYNSGVTIADAYAAYQALK